MLQRPILEACMQVLLNVLGDWRRIPFERGIAQGRPLSPGARVNSSSRGPEEGMESNVRAHESEPGLGRGTGAAVTWGLPR